MKKWLLASIIFPLFLMGCEADTKPGFSKQKLHGNWVLTKIDGKDITIAEPQTVPNMAIDTELKVAGFSGCNRFFGQVELAKGYKLRVVAMGATKMACVPEDQAQIESVMTKSLQKWNSVALENKILTLTSEQHILTFIPTDYSDDIQTEQ
ncbi:META domain-containing protein [uncultured Photobacterium sp.]|uniref:META domain-containing protein n=1 Tax=uncultured Photobacterium sp. TaxID=173973 RepID=UPI002634093C|nr:META domain-containing protein [uncultured Photobacterium sp.]